MGKFLVGITIVFLWLIGSASYFEKTVSAQSYKIEGWPVRKSWGAVRGNYIDPRTAELRFIFEDQAGTIRIVTINPEAKTAVPVVEMRRE